MSHPLSVEFQQQIDANPFGGMKIGDSSALSKLEGRYPCPKCGKSRKYFCYVCYAPVSVLQGTLPMIKVRTLLILSAAQRLETENQLGKAKLNRANLSNGRGCF